MELKKCPFCGHDLSDKNKLPGYDKSRVQSLPRNYQHEKSISGLDHIYTNHDHLITRLGLPHHVEEMYGDFKVTTEWLVKFDGHIFSVHDYKASILYGDGGDNLTLVKIRSSYNIGWTIGGEADVDPQPFIDYLLNE